MDKVVQDRAFAVWHPYVHHLRQLCIGTSIELRIRYTIFHYEAGHRLQHDMSVVPCLLLICLILVVLLITLPLLLIVHDRIPHTMHALYYIVVQFNTTW